MTYDNVHRAGAGEERGSRGKLRRLSLIDERDALLRRMIDVQGRFGGSVVALIEVPMQLVSMYGCAAVATSLFFAFHPKTVS